MLLLLWSVVSRAATFALLVNGGDQPDTNYRTHLEHLQEVHQTLVDRGIQPEDIAVFSADGSATGADMTVGLPSLDPRAWLIEGTALEVLAPRRVLVDSTWEGVALQPARGVELQHWFADAAHRIRPGDTLLIYVTDHGLKGTESLEDASIALWGERLSVAEFRELLTKLHPDVRVMVTMSQCYAGSFAQALYPINADQPQANRCGWFAAPPDRPSYGCYPESREQSIGHGFRWSEAMSRRSSLADAHDEVLLTDRTPDVPVSSTDVHIERTLRSEARARAMLPEALVDELLAESSRHPTQLALEHRAKISALAEGIGSGTPLDLREVRRLHSDLPAMYEGLLEGARMWQPVLSHARTANIDQFLLASPRWNRRLGRAPSLDPEGREALLLALLEDLDTATPPEQKQRIQHLMGRLEEARQGAWRTAVREGIILRMSYLLKRIAAEHLLAQGLPHLDADREAMETLTRCETIAPGKIPGHAAAMTTPTREQWPPLQQDLQILEGVTAPWLGASFGPVSQARTEHLGLPAGAVALHVVFADSPADRAGLMPGDILVGPTPNAFDTPFAMQEWLLTVPRGEDQPMHVWRGYQELDTQIQLASWLAQHAEPTQKPAKSMGSLWLYDDEGLPLPQPEGAYLLFFWATWCAPCKAAAPEVVAWSQETGVPVYAVTDQDLDAVAVWRRRYRGAFPTLAFDPTRDSQSALVVTELPTFVHIGADGTVLARQEGYSKLNGLFP